MKDTIGFIGAGNMAEALIKGILTAGLFSPQSIHASDIRDTQLKKIKKSYGIRICKDNAEVIARTATILLAIKPQNMENVLREIAPLITTDHLIISIAAGITTHSMLQHLNGAIPIIRIMPNTPALIQEGASVLTKGKHATETHCKRAQKLFGSVGTVVTVDESLMDAVTGLSGSGPAYVFSLH